MQMILIIMMTNDIKYNKKKMKNWLKMVVQAGSDLDATSRFPRFRRSSLNEWMDK
jgi:hypothetical protein